MFEELTPEAFAERKNTLTVRNPFSLDIAEATHIFFDTRTQTALLLPEHDTFYETLTSRSYPLVSREDQRRLRSARIGIAGQGTVGGNLAIAMARYGFERLRTSDPDTFEVTNLNRQPCNLLTVGNDKAAEVAYQAQAINPFMEIEQYAPVTADNLGEFIRGCDVVISALDNTSLIVGLNIEARKQKIPVVLGTDVGSGILLDIFDYRNTEDLMHGRVQESDVSLPPIQLIFKFLGIENFPVEMLDALQLRIQGEVDYFAQTIVSASVCSAALIKAITFILTGQAVKPSTAIDLLSVLMTDEDEKLRHQRQAAMVASLKQALDIG